MSMLDDFNKQWMESMEKLYRKPSLSAADEEEAMAAFRKILASKDDETEDQSETPDTTATEPETDPDTEEQSDESSGCMHEAHPESKLPSILAVGETILNHLKKTESDKIDLEKEIQCGLQQMIFEQMDWSKAMNNTNVEHMLKLMKAAFGGEESVPTNDSFQTWVTTRVCSNEVFIKLMWLYMQAQLTLISSTLQLVRELLIAKQQS